MSTTATVLETQALHTIPVPSISFPHEDATSYFQTQKGPQLDDEEVARLERMIRKIKLRRKHDVVRSTNKDEYQRQWTEEISEFLVNHPKSKMRILFKRLEKTPYTNLERPPQIDEFVLTSSPIGPPKQSSPAGRNASWTTQTAGHGKILDDSSSVRSDVGERDDREAKKVQLEDLFTGHQIWTSWQYQYAYPRLTSFLAAVPTDHNFKTRCEVNLKDFLYQERFRTLDAWDATELRKIQRHKATRLTQDQKLLNHEELWNRTRSRFKFDGSQWLIPCRVLKIVDLSPTCATILVGSSPRMDLSYIATFLERYLSNSNWATANLITANNGDSMLRNYLLEYHFSFYHVTSSPLTNSDIGYGDDRSVRQASPFTAGKKARARRIYEEQLSFLVIGHGGDVYTNIQLAEKYSCDPEDDSYDMPFYLKSEHEAPRMRDPFSVSYDDRESRPKGIAFFVDRRKPCSAFLAWIANSLRHVVTRWQSAINAVDVEIQSSFQATFHGDKHSLLSDDSSFSKSKKYIWAIQVYKVFEKKIEQTISVWKDFEANSLDKLDDSQLTKHKQESLDIIHAAVESLERKLVHVRTRGDEVSDMKDGLFATSQLLDSRVSVRQNDNIKLLTYVNLLFLPLAFCTSIFGMQTILPNQVHASWFAITLCCVTVFTAFLVFNLQIMSEVVESMIGKGTKGLRELMHIHHRPHWHKTGQALQTSRDATTIIVQNRLRRTSHWMYFVFMIEAILVTIPVRELKALGVTGRWTRSWWRRHTSADSEPRPTRKPLNNPSRMLNTAPATLEEESRAAKLLTSTGHFILGLLRAILSPLWLLIIGAELVVLLAYLVLKRAFNRTKKRHGIEKEYPELEQSIWRQALVKLGFYEEDKRQLPVAFQRKLRRWHAEYMDRSEQHARHQRLQSLKHGDSYYKRRSEIEAEAKNRRSTINEAGLAHLAHLAVPSVPPKSRRNSESNLETHARRNSQSNLAPQSILRDPSPSRPAMARTRSWRPNR